MLFLGKKNPQLRGLNTSHESVGIYSLFFFL